MSEAPDLFTCPNHTGSLRVSEATCSTWWTQGRKARPWDRLAPCRGCQIGAKLAGFEHCADKPPEMSAHRCTICGKAEYRRGLILGIYCVGCSNRMREIITGRWRRAHPPGLARRLHVFAVEVAE